MFDPKAPGLAAPDPEAPDPRAPDPEGPDPEGPDPEGPDPGAPDLDAPDPASDPSPREHDRWPARALAGIAAAGATAWLAAHVLSPPPLAPAATALLAGVLVAALPRLAWLSLTAAITVTLAIQSQPGAALVILTAALVPVVLDVRRPTGWPLAAAAPALGAVGLAGAWPALAARGRTVWQRAVLGITGWVWLAIAGSLADVELYATGPGGALARSVRTQSLYDAAHQVLAPLLSAGMLAPAAVWGVAAVALPWIRSERSPGNDAVRVAIWAAALLSATIAALDLGHGAGRPAPGVAVAGATAAALAALAPRLAPRLASAWHDRPRPADIDRAGPRDMDRPRSTDIEHQVP